MHVSNRTTVSDINFLAAANPQTFTYQVSDAGVTANAQGRKIVPAGTILPVNDATAAGILYTDVDVTAGPQPGALIVEGYILSARLPVAPAATAITALKEIKFR